MAVDKNSLMSALVPTDVTPKKGRVDFETAMRNMGFTSVFDIIRLPKPAFARQLALYCDVDADLAYDNAMAYAALIGRLYREYKTSAGTLQQLAQRSGIRSLVSLGPTFPNLFKERWDEFCKVGAIAAFDSPVAYLSALRVFIQQLEATSIDPKRILLDRRRPDLKDLLITHDSTFTPRPMLEIVNDVLSRNLRTYLDGVPADKPKSINQVLAERRYPFELPYNFHHHQCQLGLSESKPRLGELNYRASLLLPITHAATHHYGEVQSPVLQAQQLLSGLSPQQQALLIEHSVFSNFYLVRSDLTNGWQSAGNTYLCPHTPLRACFLLPLKQEDIGTVNPEAHIPGSATTTTNLAPVTFRTAGQTHIQTVTLKLNSATPTSTSKWLLNGLHAPSQLTTTSFIQVNTALPEPTEEGYTATFDLITATGPAAAPVNLALQRFTLTLDEQYNLTTAEKAFFKQSYGIEISDGSPLWQMADLNDFMQRTGLLAEQVERLLCQRTYAVRLSPNCPSKNLQHAGVTIPNVTGKVLPFPHASHYGACYVNGTGTGSDLFDSQIPPTSESIIRDQFDNSMGLEQVEMGDTKYWHLTKTSLDRFDRLQRMVRLQRWTGIPFAKLDTLIICAIRAEGEANLGMELNQNTLRALGVYRHLNRRHGIDAQEFAALMHDLTPYASGKDEVPLFDQVFNRVQLFDTPLILDQAPINLAATDAATQKTLLQLCAGLGLQPTEESLLLIARQTQTHLKTLKRDLPTVSSIYRQARIAQLFGLSVAELLTLAVLLGGLGYKSLLASGQLNPPTQPEVPEIPATPETPAIPATPEIPHVVDLLDVLMQLDWAVDWLKDSQQTVTLLQQRLGPNAPLKATADIDGAPSTATYEYPPLSDELLTRLSKLHDDTDRSLVTEKQLAALGLPTADLSDTPLLWFEILNADLIDDNGLLLGLDEALTRVDEAPVWIREKVKSLLEPMNLTPAVKDECEEKLVGLLLVAHDTQAQVVEGLFQETAKLSPELTAAVVHWTGSSFYSLLLDALDKEDGSALIDQFQRVLQHAEIVINLRLSNSALRLFLINPQWLGADQYPESYGEPSFADLYLFERFSHWLHAQSQPEDTLLSYFSLANPIPSKLKNKALRKKANETANSALALLLEWPEEEIAVLTKTLPDERARSMAQVDWIRRCQATCRASGLSAKALLQATELNEQSTWEAWKAVGDAVMASHPGADSLPVNG